MKRRYVLNAGDMDKFVALENPVRTPDGDGGFTNAWHALSPAQVWASVLPATAGRTERLVAGTVQAAATHIVEMRHHPDVTVRTRVTVDGTRYLQVTGVQNVDEASVVTRLMCVEIVPSVSPEVAPWT
jgi:SPP1 family predicted phage head-tail adaptor